MRGGPPCRGALDSLHFTVESRHTGQAYSIATPDSHWSWVLGVQLPPLPHVVQPLDEVL